MNDPGEKLSIVGALVTLREKRSRRTILRDRFLRDFDHRGYGSDLEIFQIEKTLLVLVVILGSESICTM